MSPDRLLETAYLYRTARVLLSAVELGVFTELAKGALAESILRERLAIASRGARDFFDALVALGLLERCPAGDYSNAVVADLYLDAAKATYIGGLLESLGAREFGAWGSLTTALRTGQPQSGIEASEHFGQLHADPARRTLFVRGMTGASRVTAWAMAERFPWQQYTTLLDVGTAQGCLPIEIAKRHSHITGGGFDLPVLRDEFDGLVRENGLQHRLRFHGGDFFSEPLPSADVLVMGRVLHNWDIDRKRLLLRKAYDALPSDGALIVYESFIDSERNSAVHGLLSSLNMLIMTAGGFDFTPADCTAWMREAGFQDLKVEPLTKLHAMITGVK
jgi:hypothetical protein